MGLSYISAGTRRQIGFNQVWPLINCLYLPDHRGLPASISSSVLKKQSGTLRLHSDQGLNRQVVVGWVLDAQCGFLLDRHALREIPRLVHVATQLHREMIGKKL